MLSPQQIAAKWERNLSGARQSYIDGVGAVTVSPMESAIAASARWRAALEQAFIDKRYERGLREAGTLLDWQQKCVQVGAARLTAGAAAARPKVERFFTSFLPFLAANVATVRQMPANTFQERIARMVRMAELNHQYRSPAGQFGG